MGLFNRKILMKEITNSVFFKVLMSMIKRELPYVVGGNIVGENEPEDILLDLMISLPFLTNCCIVGIDEPFIFWTAKVAIMI